MALKICLKFLLSLSPSTWKLHRTGWYDSSPNIFLPAHLWAPPLVTTLSLKKTELLLKPTTWNKLYHPGSIHPKHLFPCYLHWNNVIYWKNKASINPGGHFEPMKSFFSASVQTHSKQHSAVNSFSLYIVYHKIKFYKNINMDISSITSLDLNEKFFLWGLRRGVIN